MELRKAATEMRVDQPFIDEVNLWDGEEDLQAGQDEDADEDAEGDTNMNEDDVPLPPTRVMEAYQKATSLLHKLGEDTDS